jgi:hypothetical protein
MKTFFPVSFSVHSTQVLVDDVLPAYGLGEIADCKLQYVFDRLLTNLRAVEADYSLAK